MVRRVTSNEGGFPAVPPAHPWPKLPVGLLRAHQFHRVASEPFPNPHHRVATETIRWMSVAPGVAFVEGANTRADQEIPGFRMYRRLRVGDRPYLKPGVNSRADQRPPGLTMCHRLREGIHPPDLIRLIIWHFCLGDRPLAETRHLIMPIRRPTANTHRSQVGDRPYLKPGVNSRADQQTPDLTMCHRFREGVPPQTQSV